MPNILVVDDEITLVTSIVQHLDQEGFNVRGEIRPTLVLSLLEQEKWDLLILDWMMPEISGIDLLREIRKKSEIPVIFLTARTDEYDKLLGLEIGADDYITKPFSIRELIVRIRVILRRAQKQNGEKLIDDEIEVIEYHPIRLIPSNYQVWINEVPIPLTTTEFQILQILMQKPGRVYSRAQLVEMVMGTEYIGYERSIDTHILNIRKKCKQIVPEFDGIKTVFGVGYKLGEKE